MVTTLNTKVEYNGDGIVSLFPITFEYIDSSQIYVALKNNATLVTVIKTLGADYSLGTSAVTMTVAPNVGETLIIFRLTTKLQSYDFLQNTAYLAEDLEKLFDRQLMMIQENDPSAPIMDDKYINFDTAFMTGALPAVNGGTGQAGGYAIGDLLYSSGPSSLAKLPVGGSGQVLKSVGGLPTWATFSGGINYISSNPDAEADTSGWATFADLAATIPADGTGGSPNSTWTRTSTSPLRGSGSFLYTHNSGASRQGEGVSFLFQISPADRAKVIQVSFDYMIASGTFVAGSAAADSDLTAWIYDVNNSKIIQLSNYKLLSNSTSIADKFSATFQSASNASLFRLIIFNGTTSTAAFTAMFDNFNVGPSTYVYGSPVTDPVAYTPTFTGFGTATNINVSSWKDGAYLFGEGTFTAGTTTATQAQITMGYGGANANVTSLSTISASLVVVGKWSSSTTNQQGVVLAGQSRNYLVLGLESSATNGLAAINGSAITTGSVVSFNFRCPIQGWSSSVQMSDQADTRVVDWIGYVASNQAVTANVTNIPLTSRKDSHGGWGGSSYTVIVPGDYSITGVSSPTTAVSYYTQVYVNGVVTRSLASSAGGANACGATVLNDLKAGDVISFRSGVTLTVAADTMSSFTITRISGPTTIAETEAILVSYGSTAGSAIGTSYTLQTFTAKEIDTHGCWNGTDTFTAQTPGNYRISAGILTAAVTLTTAQSITLAVYKNGSLYRNIARAVGNGASIAYMLNGDDFIYLKSYETLQIYAVCSIATSQSSSGANNRVSITRDK